MSWITHILPKIKREDDNERKPSPIPEGVWTKCPGCEQPLYTEELRASLQVCPKCGYHHRIGARQRLLAFLDPESAVEIAANVRSVDPLGFVDSKPYPKRIAAAEAAVVTSGTATLETALLGTPEVVVYRTLWFQVKLQPYVLKVPWVSLVNLNLGREAVAEIIQSDLDVARAERELRAILPGGAKRGRMEADFEELRTVIGGPGASERFARRMVGELKKNRT